MRNRPSYCWYSDDVAVDPFYGLCSADLNEIMLKKYSSADNEVALCAANGPIPVGILLLYIFLFALFPLCVCGLIWYSICFGVPKFIRRCLFCGDSAAVHIEPGNTHSFSPEDDERIGTSNIRPAGRMYVIPADAVPAIATRPSINLQTGVVVQHSSGYVQMPQEGLIYSASRNVLASGDEAIRKDIPLAYAQEL